MKFNFQNTFDEGNCNAEVVISLIQDFQWCISEFKILEKDQPHDYLIMLAEEKTQATYLGKFRAFSSLINSSFFKLEVFIAAGEIRKFRHLFSNG